MTTTFLSRISRATVRSLLACVLIALSAGFISFATAPSASALCATPQMVGNWHNIDPNTRSVTRVNVGFNCGDVRLCDTEGHCTGGESYYTVHPFGKCHPSDCDWGTKRTQTMSGGWERATYTYSWSTVYVWVKTYTYYGKLYLRVYTWTDFTTADGRTDYSTDEWMLK